MGKQITFTFYFFTPSNSVFRDVSGHSGVPRCCGVPWCPVVFRCCGVPVFRCSGVPGLVHAGKSCAFRRWTVLLCLYPEISLSYPWLYFRKHRFLNFWILGTRAHGRKERLNFVKKEIELPSRHRSLLAGFLRTRWVEIKVSFSFSRHSSLMVKLQNTRPTICISLNKNSAYCPHF